MARGFESKSVQSQWQDAEVERELAETRSDQRREQLQAALAHLDGELKRIGNSG